MDDVAGARLDLRALLAAVEAVPPVEAIDALAAELATMLDATHVSLLVANFSGNAVMRLSHVAGVVPGDNERAESVELPGSPYEQVLLGQELVVVAQPPGWLVLVPITERGDAIGVLELSLPHHPDEESVAYLASAAHALAYVLIASRRHTDLFEWAQRDTPFSLAAEMQRRLLPSAYTLEAGAFSLAGWLEPAARVGGDTFDYSLNREYLYASITDAMGHSDEAALLATFAVASLRNSRRSLGSPAEQARIANEALLGSSRDDQFVTGLLLRIRLDDGAVEIVNAGHPPPYLVRDREATQLELDVSPALGVQAGDYEAQELRLEPGDRLLLVTDGFLERNAVRLDLSEILLGGDGVRHPREVVRELAGHVLRVTAGDLRDDATVLCIDWYGPGVDRNSIAGASRERATGA